MTETPASQILESLSAPIPPEHLAQHKQGSATLPWHYAALLLDRHAPGWTWESRSVTIVGAAKPNDQLSRHRGILVQIPIDR